MQDASCRKLTKDEILAAYRRWEGHYGKGKRPPLDADQTEEQLAVVKHLIDSGEVPYVDFALFGPHGGRLLNKQKSSGLVLDGKGGFKPIEFAGPANFALWMASFDVLANSLILLG